MADVVAENYRNYQQYKRQLAGVPGVRLTTYDETARSNYQYIILEVDETAAQISRDQLVEILHAENILARRYFYPGCHQMEPYRSLFPHAGLLLPVTESLVKRVLALPTGTAVGPNEITKICQIIRLAVEHGDDVRARLPPRVAI
jgi:dTDP-4-amino-4,6-dideoxygalactose transaminase